MNELGEVAFAQEDGRPPTALAAGQTPGEYGVSFFAARFDRGVHLSGTVWQNLVLFPLSQIRVDCRLADRRATHETTTGTLAICPAGIDFDGDGDGTIDILLIAVSQALLALTAADDFVNYGTLRERFAHPDLHLLRVAREQRDLKAVASSLSASYVVLGQVQRSGDQMRILAHLIHLPEQTHVWVTRVEHSTTEPLTLEAQVAQTVAEVRRAAEKLRHADHAFMIGRDRTADRDTPNARV